MVGKYKIVIENKKIRYTIEIKRKYTILKGDSATGKTTLCNLVSSRFKIINSNIEVITLPYNLNIAINTLQSRKNNLILIDEDNPLLETRGFEKILNDSDNYFLLITRKSLKSLPISVKEEYILKERKYNNIEKLENNLISTVQESETHFKDFQKIIIEDSKSGYQLFKAKFGDKCITSKGNGNILKLVKQCIGKYGNIAVVVDGAVFQPYLEELLGYCNQFKNLEYVIYVPESFEYIILKSGILNDLIDINLEEAYKYCDDSVFTNTFKPNFKFTNENSLVSWERFYTAYIRFITANIPDKRYTKDSINTFYLQNTDKIIQTYS